MYSIILNSNVSEFLSPTELFALLIACICHDIDHRGTTNSYQVTAHTSLAALYGTSATLEQHHFHHAVHILNSEGHNIFQNLNEQHYKQVLQDIESAILATDLSNYTQNRSAFLKLVESHTFDANNATHRQLLRSILMTVCDISSVAKPWEVARKSALDCFVEFFQQGDKEKKMGHTPLRFMDRSYKQELPEWEVSFIDSTAIPAYKCLASFLTGFDEPLNQLMENRKKWQELQKSGVELL
jgi:dual 3',5'-cyclic-AMP and -GMP phosphodiesterase 11